MSYMFYNSDFNGDLSKWDIHNAKNIEEYVWNIR